MNLKKNKVTHEIGTGERDREQKKKEMADDRELLCFSDSLEEDDEKEQCRNENVKELGPSHDNSISLVFMLFLLFFSYDHCFFLFYAVVEIFYKVSD
ncbi:hypothetical protein E2C01_049287 [Portunus trituberculatus]|uniref:Uncharacterized protein n=1 Tax=Portunus trituberculatus TaxID=210409 RepID=A0A5B7GFN5_PORTR|nr:hypothetical protein [Portunus trituberculatus]